MKTFRYTLLLVLFLSGGVLGQEGPVMPDNGPTALGPEFETASEKLEGADAARDSGKLMQALELYEGARDLYQNLAKLFPERDAILVEFRIDYCRDQLDNIRKILAITGVLEPPLPDQQPEPDEKPVPTADPLPPVPSDDGNALVETPAPESPPQTGGEPLATTGIANLAAEGRAALKKGDLPKARASLMRALDENPDDKKVRLLLAMVQCRAGRFEDATYLLVELIGEMPENAMAHVALGTAYFGMGRSEDAAKLMKRAIELDDSLHEAYYNMVQIILSTKPADLDAARQYYKQALELGGKKDEKLEFLLK